MARTAKNKRVNLDPDNTDAKKTAKKKKVAKPAGTVVAGTAKIDRLVIGVKGCQIVIGQFDLKAEDCNQLNRWIKQEEPLVLTIDNEIVTALKLDKVIITKKGEVPNLTGLKYSSNQIAELTRCVQSDSLVDLTFRPDTESLFQAQMDAEDGLDDADYQYG